MSVLDICIWWVSWLIALMMFGLGNTVGYHRMLTHRSFRSGKGVRYVLTLLGAAHSGAPITWVGLHRLHHLRSDGDLDPHSPAHGFWHAHCGWLVGSKNPAICIAFALSGFGQQAALAYRDVRRLVGRNPPEWRSLCPDLMKERLLVALDAPLAMFAYFLIQLALCGLVAGWLGILWLWALHVTLTNLSWSVNSVCHSKRAGSATFDVADQSRDVGWLAWLVLGEGHHNSHHRFPRSARHGLQNGPDLSYAAIRGLARLGLVQDVWLPRDYR